jgi:gas vesicle protein
MSIASIDTHRIVKRLIEAGFSDVQAETVTDVVRETHQQSMADLATKADLQSTEARLEAKIKDLRTELKGDIADLRAEIKGDIADLRAELKGDIADLRAELKGDIADLRADLKKDIADLKTELRADKIDTLKWVIGMILVQGGVVVTLLKVMH